LFLVLLGEFLQAVIDEVSDTPRAIAGKDYLSAVLPYSLLHSQKSLIPFKD